MPDTDELVEEYLRRLDQALHGAPAERRRELLDDISEHISLARESDQADSPARTRVLLDRLGDPEEIAAEAWPADERAGRRSLAIGVVTIGLLLVGGILLPVVGWIIGVILLWSSALWSKNEKVVGTLLLPGGLLPAFVLLLYPSGEASCTRPTPVRPRPPGTAPSDLFAACSETGSGTRWLLVVLLIAVAAVPTFTAIYLGRRLRLRFAA
jgi:hypothetical protein